MDDKDADTMEEEILGLDDTDDGKEIAEALSELIEQLADDDNINMFTDLSQEEIRHISVLKSMNDDVIDEFIKEFESLQVSYRRKGRQELIDIAESLGSLAKDEEQESRLKRLKGGLL